MSSLTCSNRLARAGIIAVYVLLLVAVGWAGVRVRNWLFANSSDYRMRGDITNGWNRGHAVVREARRDAGLGPGESLNWRQFWNGYLGFYDKVAARGRGLDTDQPRFALDYSPVRLLIMSAWTKHVGETWPNARGYDDRYAWPLMHLNSALSAAGALAMFAAVTAWLRRCRTTTPPPTSRCLFHADDWPWVAGAIAGVVFWLNPSTILDSHGFAQWDVWITPFVLAAMGLAATERWGLAGATLGLSMTFKGQALMITPVFVLWPLVSGQWGAAARFAAAFVLAFLAQGLPWLINGWFAWTWLGLTVGAAIVLVWTPLARSPKIAWPIRVLLIAMIVGPFLTRDHWRMAVAVAMPMTALLLGLPHLPRKARWTLVTLLASAGIVAAALRFGGSWNWLVISYVFPSYQYRRLAMGPTSNLPALLAAYGWNIDSPIDWLSSLYTGWSITLRQVLVGVYAIALALCAAGAAIAQRRRDPRLLLALATPWVLMFALVPQMHERYLMWAAAVLGVAVAVSPGLFLLHLVVVVYSSLMIFHQMLRTNPQTWPSMTALLDRTCPGIAWLLLLAAAIFVYCSVIPGVIASGRFRRLDPAEATSCGHAGLECR